MTEVNILTTSLNKPVSLQPFRSILRKTQESFESARHTQIIIRNGNCLMGTTTGNHVIGIYLPKKVRLCSKCPKSETLRA